MNNETAKQRMKDDYVSSMKYKKIKNKSTRNEYSYSKYRNVHYVDENMNISEDSGEETNKRKNIKLSNNYMRQVILEDEQDRKINNVNNQSNNQSGKYVRATKIDIDKYNISHRNNNESIIKNRPVKNDENRIKKDNDNAINNKARQTTEKAKEKAEIVKKRMKDSFIDEIMSEENKDAAKSLKSSIDIVSNIANKFTEVMGSFFFKIGKKVIKSLIKKIPQVIGGMLGIFFIILFGYFLIIFIAGELFDESKEYNNNLVAKTTVEQSLAEIGLSLDNRIYNYTKVVSNVDTTTLRRDIALICYIKNGYQYFDPDNMTDEQKELLGEVSKKMINVSSNIETYQQILNDGSIIGEKSMTEFIYNGHDYDSTGIFIKSDFGLRGYDGAYTMFDNILLQYVFDNAGHSPCDNAMNDPTLEGHLFIPVCIDHRSSIPLGSILEARVDGKIYYMEVICKAHEFNDETNDANDLNFFSTTKLALGKSFFYQDEFGGIARINAVVSDEKIIEKQNENGKNFMKSEDVVLYYRTPTDLIKKNPNLLKDGAERIYKYYIQNGYTAYSSSEKVLDEIKQMWELEFGDEDGWVYAKNMVVSEQDADYKDNICNYNGIPESLWNKMVVTGKIINIEQMDINDFMLSATDEDGNPYITYKDSKVLKSLIDLYDEGYESIVKYVDSLYAGTLSDVLVENVLSSISNDECEYKTMSQLVANEYMKSGIFCSSTLRELLESFSNGKNYIFTSMDNIQKGDLVFLKSKDTSLLNILFTMPDRKTIYVSDVMIYIGEGKCVYQNETGKFEIVDFPKEYAFIARFN